MGPGSFSERVDRVYKVHVVIVAFALRASLKHVEHGVGDLAPERRNMNAVSVILDPMGDLRDVLGPFKMDDGCCKSQRFW